MWKQIGDSSISKRTMNEREISDAEVPDLKAANNFFQTDVNYANHQKTYSNSCINLIYEEVSLNSTRKDNNYYEQLDEKKVNDDKTSANKILYENVECNIVYRDFQIHQHHHHYLYYYHHNNKIQPTRDQQKLIHKMMDQEVSYQEKMESYANQYSKPYKKLLPKEVYRKIFQNISNFSAMSEHFLKNMENTLHSNIGCLMDILDNLEEMVSIRAKIYDKYTSGYKEAKKVLKQLFKFQIDELSENCYSKMLNSGANKELIKQYIALPVDHWSSWKKNLLMFQKTLYRSSSHDAKFDNIIKSIKNSSGIKSRRQTMFAFRHHQ